MCDFGKVIHSTSPNLYVFSVSRMLLKMNLTLKRGGPSRPRSPGDRTNGTTLRGRHSLSLSIVFRRLLFFKSSHGKWREEGLGAPQMDERPHFYPLL